MKIANIFLLNLKKGTYSSNYFQLKYFFNSETITFSNNFVLNIF